MSKIAVIAYETSHAVCSSMMIHVDMMADCGHDITMVVSTRIDKECFAGCMYEKVYYSSRKELKSIINENDFDKLWCTNSVYVLYLSLINVHKPIYLWMQGDTPAESYMAHHSKLRRYLLQRVVAFSFRKVAGIVYVSDAMKEYYENCYKRTAKNNIVVPCLSEFDGEECDVERIPNSFVYIGGLSVWQCFDEILDIYRQLRTEGSTFHIITLNTETARETAQAILGDTKNVEIYSITDRSRIPETLNKFQYGFLIRRHDVVNQVASPIKFLEYISCGVNVIMTDAVPSYAKIVKDYGIGSVVEIGQPCKLNPYNDNAKLVYRQLFDRDIYVQRYHKLLSC